jgi:hypothetical protein
METSLDSIQQDLNDQTSLQGDSPVKTSARPDYVQDYPVPVVAVFREFLRLLRHLRPALSLWKTWPRSAISRRKGKQPNSLQPL